MYIEKSMFPINILKAKILSKSEIHIYDIVFVIIVFLNYEADLLVDDNLWYI